MPFLVPVGRVQPMMKNESADGDGVYMTHHSTPAAANIPQHSFHPAVQSERNYALQQLYPQKEHASGVFFNTPTHSSGFAPSVFPAAVESQNKQQQHHSEHQALLNAYHQSLMQQQNPPFPLNPLYSVALAAVATSTIGNEAATTSSGNKSTGVTGGIQQKQIPHSSVDSFLCSAALLAAIISANNSGGENTPQIPANGPQPVPWNYLSSIISSMVPGMPAASGGLSDENPANSNNNGNSGVGKAGNPHRRL